MTNPQTETNQNSNGFGLQPRFGENLISICLKDPNKIIDVESAEIFAEHFSVPGHKYIFIAMMYLYSKQIKPTPMAIVEVLSNDKAKKAVDELGGLGYLIILEESNVLPDNLPIFIKKIKQAIYQKKCFSTYQMM